MEQTEFTDLAPTHVKTLASELWIFHEALWKEQVQSYFSLGIDLWSGDELYQAEQLWSGVSTAKDFPDLLEPPFYLTSTEAKGWLWLKQKTLGASHAPTL